MSQIPVFVELDGEKHEIGYGTVNDQGIAMVAINPDVPKEFLTRLLDQPFPVSPEQTTLF